MPVTDLYHFDTDPDPRIYLKKKDQDPTLNWELKKIWTTDVTFFSPKQIHNWIHIIISGWIRIRIHW